MKLLAFIEICAYVLGFLGGIGYAAYLGKWAIVVSILVLGVMAWPEFRKALYELTN